MDQPEHAQAEGDKSLVPRKNRVGALLSAYYTVGEEVPSGTPGTTQDGKTEDKSAVESCGHKSGPADLDDPAFDVHVYFHQLIQETNLNDFLRISNDLSDQIRQLDGDMQMLVYENYNKFISATDTIKQMKTDVEGMEGEMSRLTKSMETIETCSGRLNNVLSARSSKIEELASIREFLLNLRHILSLADTMRTQIKLGAAEQAVLVYIQCRPFLEKHKGVPRMSEILKETNELSLVAKKELRATLCAGRTEAGSVGEQRTLPVAYAVRLSKVLLEGGDSPETVFDIYLKSREGAIAAGINQILNSDNSAHLSALPTTTESAEPVQHEKGVSEGAGSSGMASTDADAQDSGSCSSNLNRDSPTLFTDLTFCTSCELVGKCFVTPLVETIRSAGEAFAESKSFSSELLPKLLKKYTRKVLKDLFKRCLRFTERHMPPAKDLIRSVSHMEEAMLPLRQLFSEVVADSYASFAYRICSMALRLYFCSCYKQTGEIIGDMYHSCCSDSTKTFDEVLEKVGKVEHAVLLNACLTLTECAPLLTDLASKDEQSYRQLAEEVAFLTDCFFEVFVLWAIRLCANTPAIEICSMNGEGDFSAITSINIPTVLRDVSSDRQSAEWNDMFALAFVRICKHLETKTLQKICSIATDLLPTFPLSRFGLSSATPCSLGSPNTLSSATANSSPPTDQHEVVATAAHRIRSAAEATLTAFVFHCGCNFASTLRKSIQVPSWIMPQPPQDVRSVVESVLHELHSVDTQLAKVLGNPRRLQTADQHHKRMARIFGGRRTHIELEMERLFARKAPAYAKVSFSRAAAVMGILRITFRALIEEVREETFNVHGVQQLQVDCAFLSEILRDFLDHEDSTTMEGLLDELVASAYSRCIDAPTEQARGDVLMDLAVIEGICDSKRARFAFEEDL
eukprot:GHVQ01037464.1.p1 GENE.GHVQ01037464.1~~GHVQ01037464.1.p1  ORF type:complete len:912 (+),score=113.36 GHVQ01037464.1:156-2891(+)